MGAIELDVMFTGGCSAGAAVNVNGGVPDLGVRLMSVHWSGHLNNRCQAPVKNPKQHKPVLTEWPR